MQEIQPDIRESDAKDVQLARLEAKHEERMVEKSRRKQEAALSLDPTEDFNLFWQEFNQLKATIMAKIEGAEDAASTEGEQAASAKVKAAAMLTDASDGVASLQAKVAKATHFLPRYDQRLGNDSVMLLHQTVAQARDRIFPREAFRFQSRRSPPASMTTLMAELRREVGTTSCEAHLQGDTDSGMLDPLLSFADRVGETLVKSAGDIGGKDFVLSRLKGCTVFLCDVCGALRADRLEDCKVYVGPVRSVLIEKVDSCFFSLAAQQLRIHSAKACDFYVRMRSGPIIEHSSDVRFAPYNLEYHALGDQLKQSNLLTDTGMWAKVEDFNWLRAQQSPNWSIIPEPQRCAQVQAPTTAHKEDHT